METRGFFHFLAFMCLSVHLLSETCLASIQRIGKIDPGFEASQMLYIDNDGKFILSQNKTFAFGFVTTKEDVTLFLLVIIHLPSTKIVWTANRGSPVANSDKFVFDEKGNAFLQKGDHLVWSTETGGKGITAMELQESGNLVLLGNGSKAWQSFSHPTNTLLPNQDFVEGLRLVSDPSSNNLTYILEIKSGDVILSAGFQNPQPYWSLGKDSRNTINKDGGVVAVASLNANSWRFYDQKKVSLLSQFTFSDYTDPNATWIAVLGNDGFISFYNLEDGQSNVASSTKIPSDRCSTPEPCGEYYICGSDNRCQCPSVLTSKTNCNPGIVSPCDRSSGSMELGNTGDGLNYFAWVPSTLF